MKETRSFQFEKVSRLATLIAKKALGQLTAEEQQELELWSKTSERRQQYAEMVSNSAFLDEERHRLSQVDVEGALQAMQERVRPRLVRRWQVAAAAVAVLLAGGLLVWWLQYSKVVAPELSQETQMAMKLSQESGRSDAFIETVDAGSIMRQAVSRQTAAGSAALRQGSTPRWANDEVVEQLEEARRVTTHKNKEYWLRLDDGTLVHLNYNTRLVYPEHFVGATRDVILEGEAYFMVARDRRHPFIVHTPQGDVRQYGTEFNVNTRESDGAVSVVLVKGSIGVTPNGGQELRMKPGQKLSVLNTQLSVEEVDTEPYVAWNTGYFLFRYQPLWKVTDVLAKWYDIDVTFDEAELRDISVVGDFDRYEQLDNILSALSKSTGLYINRDGRKVTLSR